MTKKWLFGILLRRGNLTTDSLEQMCRMEAAKTTHEATKLELTRMADYYRARADHGEQAKLK